MIGQNQFFSAVYRHSPIGLVIVDSKTSLVEVNHYMFANFDLTPTDYKGKQFGNVFHCSVVSESDLKCGQAEKCYNCDLRNGVTHVLNHEAIIEDLTVHHSFAINGIHTIKWFKISASAVIVEDQRFAVISFADITLEKSLQHELEYKNNELQKTKDHLQMILDSTNDAIMMLHKNGEIMNVNKTFVNRIGKSSQQLLNQNSTELHLKEQYGDLFEKMHAAITCGNPLIFEDEHDDYAYENRLYPIRTDGEITAVTLFSTDISDRKRAESEQKSKVEMETKLKVVNDFFSNISHEFKTPLSLIFMQIELMELHLNDEKKLMKIITVAKQNAYRLSRLVGNLLDITKIDAQNLKLRVQNVNIVSLAEEICKCVELYASRKKISVNVKSSLLVESMPTDLEKIERILLNLLSNAIKHTGENGQVTVWIKNRKGGGAKIIVEDNGDGIPKEKLSNIFDRFSQVDTTYSRPNEGSGIGLAIVKSLVKMLSGTIQVKSELTKGSAFSIELPLLPIGTEISKIGVGGYDLQEKTSIEFSDLYINC